MTNRTHLELSINGDRAYTDGRVLTAKPLTSGYCTGCAFAGSHPKDCMEVWDVMGECGGPWRNDQRGVVFVEVDADESEDLGEFAF